MSDRIADGVGPPLQQGAARCRRIAWCVLVALLVFQAGRGAWEECARAVGVPIAQRVQALGSDTEWRYRNALGDDYAPLLAVRAHARHDTAIVLLHTMGEASMRSMALLTGALSPHAVRQLPQPTNLADVLPAVDADVLIVVLDPLPALAGMMEARGWHELKRDATWQLWSARGTPPAAAAAPLPGNDPEHTPRMDAWRLALLLALTLACGVLWLSAFGLSARGERMAHVGRAWLIGCSWIGLLLFGWLLAGQPLDTLGPAGWTGVVLAPPAALAAWMARRRRGARAASSDLAAERATATRTERMFFAACVAFALLLLADRIVLASSRVIVGGDEGSIWAAKAKMVWDAGGFNEQYAESAHHPYAIWHQDYPPLDPMLQVFAGELAGRPLDFENRLPLQLVLVALVLVLAGSLRRCTRPAIAGLLLVVFATCRSTTEAADVAHADGLVAGGLLLLLDGLHRWRATGRTSDLTTSGSTGGLALAATGAMLLVFSKNEGLMLLLAAGLACAAGWLVRRGARRPLDATRDAAAHGAARSTAALTGARLRPAHLFWLLPALAVLVAVALQNRHFGFVNDLFDPADGGGFLARLRDHGADRVGHVLRLCADYVLTGERETRLLVAMFVALVLLFPRALLLPRTADGVRPDRSPANRTVLLATCGFLLVFLGSPFDPEWHVRWSLPRLMFQLLPVIVVSIGAAGTWLASGARTSPAPPALSVRPTSTSAPGAETP